VLEGKSTKVRQRAAEAIEDPGQIRGLIKDVRGGNDKSVYRILARKRDALLAQERQLEQLRAEISSVSMALERHSHRPYDAVFTPTLEQLEKRWQAVVAQVDVQADAEVVRRAQEAIDRAREVIAQHLRQVAFEASRQLAAANAAAEAQRQRELQAKAEAAAAAERARIEEAARKAQTEAREAETAALRHIGGLVRKAQRALEEGSTGRAAGLRRAIEEALPASPPLPAHLVRQLEQLDAKLNEIKDWKSFSVTPKRAELIAEMESLIDSNLPPPALAERIKSLQEEWRTLSRGAGENLEADWQRFHGAAERAYQPCKEYFEARAALRKENLQRRGALLDRLVAFEAQHDWEQPDWRTVIAALRESKQEWRRHSPVEPAEGKALQEKFLACTSRLQSRLDSEYARNVKEKESLIESAERLLASPDSRKAVDDVKKLQERWKAVGPVPRTDDQQLWEKFRQHCAAVFQKRQQQAADQAAELEANRGRAIALCEELEKIGALSGAELLDAVKRLPEIRLAFDEVGDLPREGARELRARFESASRQCEKAAAHQRSRAAEQGWIHLMEASNCVRAYRLASARNIDVAELETLKRAAEERIAGVGHSPKRALDAIRNALGKENSNDVAANEAALRTLCIRAEILTDTPTPPEDQARRREYQMQRLKEGLGQGLSADQSHLDELTIEWLGVGPTEEGTYLPLLERFMRCRQATPR
jgi:hypothetical protein